MTASLIRQYGTTIRKLARAHGVARVRVFGSQATGTAKRTSDVDLLVRLKADRDLLDLIEFKLDLERAMKCEVDVVSEGGLSPYLRQRILREAKPL
ncbi:MAG: nucleotidyltransferase family protein [Candidatus Omnitrophica bacterium]|nr:nucleotidyltransferase family protein [Candidatus Omnitrophota bacterium]